MCFRFMALRLMTLDHCMTLNKFEFSGILCGFADLGATTAKQMKIDLYCHLSATEL